MIKLFKTIDEKFAEIGLYKIQENEYGAIYERKNGFRHRIMLHHKSSGRHIIQSYDPDLMDRLTIGNTCVGLTMYETKLCLKKMKKMGWKVYRDKGGQKR